MSDSSKEYIDPKRLIASTSVEEFNRYSDLYYKRLPLPEYQMGKPFSIVAETAEHLRLIGYLLDGLRMKPGLRTLDFGGGVGWLSKMIWQMGCPVVCLDVSEEGLLLAKRLFDDYPVPYDPKVGYEFKLFDGHRIDLPDESVDRIICYDVFHHVPNQETVFAEFFRVLAPGGRIGFCEPLGEHSKSSGSQYEMRTYGVLENDLDIVEIAALAKRVGFGEPRFKAFGLPEYEIGLQERQSICSGKPLSKSVEESLRLSIRDSGIFYFQKGEEMPDSRSAEGLVHCMLIDVEGPLKFPAKTMQWVDVTVTNAGSAKWLKGSPAEIGTVNIGTQLFDTEGRSLEVDLTRGGLPRAVLPGETVQARVPLVVKEPGKYRIGFDLVAELVCWFHLGESEMVFLDVEVE